MIHHLKYDGFPALAAEMARVVARCVTRPASGVLVPIPLSAKRLRWRGYNQAAVLAGALRSLWSQPVHQRLLSRSGDTRSQTSLAPQERRVNVRNVFKAAPPQSRTGNRPSAVILVDDVLTTGATLAAAAEALQEAGWREIGAVTFARAMPFVIRSARERRSSAR